MATKNWYWKQFDVTKKGDRFDLSDVQTKELRKQDLSDEQIAEYETDFIDQLYGTKGGKAFDGSKDRTANIKDRKALTKTTIDDYSDIEQERVDVHWGLDLKRKWINDRGEKVNVGHRDFYEVLTTGDIDWKAYDKDNAYKAYRQKHLSGASWTSSHISEQKRVEHVRAANAEIAKAAGEEQETREPPTGEYDADKIKGAYDADGNFQLTIDGKVQPTLSELYNQVDAEGNKKGRQKVGFTYTRVDQNGNDVNVTVSDTGKLTNAFDPIAGPPTVVVKPKINIPNIKVKVPASLSQWKGLASKTLKVGGKK